MDNISNEQPVAVYKTTISIILYEVLYLGVTALFFYIILSTKLLWARFLSGVCAVLFLVFCIQLFKHRKDCIVVSQRNLSLCKIYTKTRHGKWRNAHKVDIPWHEIKDFSSDFNIDFGLTINRIFIHKNVIVKLRNRSLCCIESDLYDVLFLKRKLKAYWKEFNKKK